MTNAHPRRGTAGLCALTLLAASATAGCSVPSASSADRRPSVVATTGLLADLIAKVAGPDVDVHSIVPPGGDPHSYEPTLRSIRNIVYADAAFSNYLLLEEHSIIRSIDANIRPGVEHIPIAERATKHGATVLPLVENRALDTIWLGFRVRGDGVGLGADRSSTVRLRATGMSGPGHLSAFVTETFGRPKPYFTSRDGFDDNDVAELPVAAHTHVTWAFTEPGEYRLNLTAELVTPSGVQPVPGGSGTVVFAVGIDPSAVSDASGRTRLADAHADVTVGLDAAGPGLAVVVDQPVKGRRAASQQQSGHMDSQTVGLAQAVIHVPTHALSALPADPAYRFVGQPGSDVYQLAQAVLGKHVHGDIDPHLWHDVRNVKAYLGVVCEELSRILPDRREGFIRRRDAYLAELTALDAWVHQAIAEIPPAKRHIVTSHDAFAYLAAAYDMQIAGFVTPNPSTEPSIAERTKLLKTLRNQHIPAVFLEPTARARSVVLQQVADDAGVQVCDILGDSLTPAAPSYTDFMVHNVTSLRSCLAGLSTSPPQFRNA